MNSRRIRRIPVVFVLWSFCTLPLLGQGPEGQWKGIMTRDGADLEVQFTIHQRGTDVVGTFSSPPMHVMEYPFDSVTYSSPSLRFSLVGDSGDSTLFEGTLSERTMEGTFQVGSDRGTFRLQQSTPAPLPYDSEQVNLANKDILLAGSLYTPRLPGRHPVIIFIHGSGSQTRWGRYRSYADYFARRGVAALIYDKRGTGQSAGDWRNSDFNDLAADALAGIELLKKDPRIDQQKIGIYGQSQGGGIAPLIASQSDAVAFAIAVAGPAIPMWQTQAYALKSGVRDAGVNGDALERANRFIDLLIQVLRSGEERDQLTAAAETARQNGEPWYELLKPPPNDSYFWSFFRGIADYDAAEYWRRVQVPTLIIEAGNDKYVPAEQSIAAMKQALQASGTRDYTIVVLPNAPHTFLITPDKGQPFRWPYPYPGLVDLLGAWVLYRTGVTTPAVGP